MEQIENKHQEEVKLILRIIDKLLSLPLGEQIYSKEIYFLFEQLHLIAKPMFVV